MAGGPDDDDETGVPVSDVFLNDDMPPVWGLGPEGLATSEVGEGILSLPLSEPSLFGILGGTFKSLGLSPLLSTFGEGVSSPGTDTLPSLSVMSLSLSSLLMRMYFAGTKPSVPFMVPSHQSGLKRLKTRIMSPFLKESSLEERAE